MRCITCLKCNLLSTFDCTALLLTNDSMRDKAWLYDYWVSGARGRRGEREKRTGDPALMKKKIKKVFRKKPVKRWECGCFGACCGSSLRRRIFGADCKRKLTSKYFISLSIIGESRGKVRTHSLTHILLTHLPPQGFKLARICQISNVNGCSRQRCIPWSSILMIHIKILIIQILN